MRRQRDLDGSTSPAVHENTASAADEITDISVVSVHFAEFAWTELLVKQVLACTPIDRLREIVLVDQDRTEASFQRLANLHPLVRVLQYERSEWHFDRSCHDHAAALNAVMRDVRGSFVCLFDSDAHPVRSDWLAACERLFTLCDALAARDPNAPTLTHPCFMFLRRRHLEVLAFDEDGTDTGRSIGRQLAGIGERVCLLPFTRAFSGWYGYVYLDSVYHHNHGSFHGASHALFAGQTHWDNAHFRKRVIACRRYEMSAVDYLLCTGRRLLGALRRRIKRRPRARSDDVQI